MSDTAKILHLPLPANRPAQSPPPHHVRARACRPSEIDLAGIARRLGMADWRVRRIIARLRQLADRAGFPLPKTPRFWGGRRVTGPSSIDAHAIWDRDAVELWLDNDLPPGAAAARAAASQAATRADLASRARKLAGVA